ncbi:DUF6185 family protein [Streptomyces sp. NPDC059582]|uniref:DUF6185 family protein n=1 Tax=Streptomyces sp. NPDC059582 TaxID=3346875 RepID=UPI0036B7CD09
MLVAVLLGVFAVPEQAHAMDDVCSSAGLAGGWASASVRLDDHNRTQTKIVSRQVVHVPAKWKYATGLLLGEDSKGYRRAMRCLMRGSAYSQFQWWDEWRPRSPEITTEKSGVKVQVDTYAWADNEGMTYVGPWDVVVGHDYWRIRLHPAEALAKVTWSSVVVDPGSASAVSAEPRPTSGKGDAGLVWQRKSGRTVPVVDVRLDPGWQRSWGAQADRLRFLVPSSVGWALWGWSIGAALIYSAYRARRTGPLSPAQEETITMAGQWGWITLLISLVLAGHNAFYAAMGRYFPADDWGNREAHHGLVGSIALGLVLLAFGFPRRWTIWCAAAVLALPGLAVAYAPERWGLSAQTFFDEYSPDKAVLALFTAAGCAFALLLMGSVASGWRLARSAGVIRPRRAATPGGPLEPRELRLRHTGPAVVLAVIAIGLCLANTRERDWQRASWLSAREEGQYGTDHLQALRDELTWFSVNSVDWWAVNHWLLAGLAILAVLRASASGSASPAGSPGPGDERWMLVFFPVMVGMGLGWFVGNGVLSWLWFFVNLAALGLVLRFGRGRSVLDKHLQKQGAPLAEAIGPAQRHELLDRARRYREIHAKLRRLDQGQADDEALNRRAYERELRRLHNWRDPSSGTPDKLPVDVSVVDAALALGPYDTWWGNGGRAARLGALIGIPATVLMVWAEQLRGDSLTSTLYYGFGMPNVPLDVLYWEVTWAGAAFLLGALWRRLPGRRGPVRSLSVAAAFALPIGIDSVGNWFTGEAQTNLALYAAAMLLVLTLTGIAIDLDTFRGERRYWQSRLGLLLSVYQMRYFSLQMAYLLAQLVAVFTLWQFFTDAGGPPEPGAGGETGTTGS